MAVARPHLVQELYSGVNSESAHQRLRDSRGSRGSIGGGSGSEGGSGSGSGSGGDAGSGASRRLSTDGSFAIAWTTTFNERLGESAVLYVERKSTRS